MCKNLKICFEPDCEELEKDIHTKDNRITYLETMNRNYRFELSAFEHSLKDCESRVRTIPAPPNRTEQITKQEARDILTAACGNCEIYLADNHYTITTISEMKRFIWEDAVYTMQYIAETQDCDDFTRKLKGDLVCKGWSSQVPLDVWFTHPTIGAHSEFLTILLNDEDGSMDKTVYLIEGQLSGADAFELAEEMFEGNKPRVIKQ